MEGAMSAASKKVANLTHEIKQLKEEKIELIERCECYKKQVSIILFLLLKTFITSVKFVLKIVSRDREIERLSALLEGGRPVQAVNSECCYKDSEGRICRMRDEINLLKKEKSSLENCLKGINY